MEIFVRSLTGRTITIWANSSDFIRTLQKQIEAKMGTVPWDALRLIFGGKHLDVDSKVSDYQIFPHSTIDMVFRFPGGGLRLRLPVSISIKLVNGDERFNVNVDLLDTINELKRLILDEHPEHTITLGLGELIYKSKVLADERTLVYYDIDDDSTLYLVC